MREYKDFAPIRESFGSALVKTAERRPDIAVFGCDLNSAVKTDKFKKTYPERYFECGIAESNAVSQAAGYALEGGRPFVASFGHFLTGMYLPITQSVMQNNAPVVLVGSHPGLSIGKDGPTQMGLRDIGVMRLFPNVEIIEPVDAFETEQVVEYLADSRKPAYLRIGRFPVPRVTPDDHKFQIGKGNVLRDGNDAAIFASGSTVYPSLAASEELADEKNLGIAVINMSSLKPHDADLIRKMGNKTGRMLTVQDHYIDGGLADLVSKLEAPRIIWIMGQPV